MLIIKQAIGTCAYMGGLMSNPEPFTWSMVQLVQYTNEYMARVADGEFVHWDRAGTSYHAWARNGLVKRFLGEWLCMLDTDQTFAPDLLARLVGTMRHYNIDVLTGLYHYKVPPHLPVLYWRNPGDRDYGIIANWDQRSEIIEAPCAGAGCLLVRRPVFDRIREELQEEPFDPITPWSEDFSFFDRLQRLRIKAYCCPAIETRHLAYREITSADRDLSEVQTADVQI